MKKLIAALALSTIAATSFAAVVNAPINSCIVNNMQAGNDIQVELSYPGASGIYSGYFTKGQKVCMHPYDWRNPTSIFDMFGVIHDGFHDAYYFQCGGGMTVSHGRAHASANEIDYSLHIAPSSGAPTCDKI